MKVGREGVTCHGSDLIEKYYCTQIKTFDNHPCNITYKLDYSVSKVSNKLLNWYAKPFYKGI